MFSYRRDCVDKLDMGMVMKQLPDDPRFRYVSLYHTDVAKTFARVRRQIKEEKERREAIKEEVAVKVRRIVK